MKPWIIAVIFLLVLAGVAIASQRRGETHVLSEAKNSTQEKLVIYDVRTPEEYAAGHVENAYLLPLQDIQKGIRPAEPTDTAIGVYCRSGNRSREATEILRKAAYTNITDLGGIGDVQRHGYKLIR